MAKIDIEILTPSEKGTDCRGVIFPWDDVNKCLDKKIPALANHLSCPICGKASEDLVWINFNSPEWTWDNYCGRYGPLSICPKCHYQVEFLCMIMS